MHMFAIAKRLVDGMWVSAQDKSLSHTVSVCYENPQVEVIVEMSVDRVFVRRHMDRQQQNNKQIRMCEHCG